MLRCPFYGFRWPDLNPVLRHVGGNECGLDLEHNGVCEMEAEKRHVDYFACPFAVSLRNQLHPFENIIRFEQDSGKLISLAEWVKTAKR